MVLGRFADLDQPKVVFYFADTMRMRSGEHYLYLFGDRTKYENVPELPELRTLHTRMTMDSFSGMNAYDRVLREAGHRVVATDLIDYGLSDSAGNIDFLKQDNAPERVGSILTNPPYRHANKFVRHGLKLVPRLALLLPLGS